MTKKLTSFTQLITGEGSRISYTYSTIDDDGTIINQNERGNFIVVDTGLQNHIDAIRDFIIEHKLS